MQWMGGLLANEEQVSSELLREWRIGLLLSQAANQIWETYHMRHSPRSYHSRWRALAAVMGDDGYGLEILNEGEWLCEKKGRSVACSKLQINRR